jgi:N-methylhydantoinase B
VIDGLGLAAYCDALTELNRYAERLAQQALSRIPDGLYRFQDLMDSDGQGRVDIPIQVSIKVTGHHIEVDFAGTAEQVPGNINCPLSVAAAGVYYVFRCLMPDTTPNCAGSLNSIQLHAPEGCLLNARYPAAVAAGNVETSTRVVDVVMGALAKAVPELIPAASHGSMNNLAMGARDSAGHWDYYETIGGGMGGGPQVAGLDALQTHMTNTRNTPVEVLESLYPVRVTRYQVRRGSGGKGLHNGGDGICREIQFLQSANVTLLTERRRHAPWGLNGGSDGQTGFNSLNGKQLPDKVNLSVEAGDVLCIETAGGGAWGQL